MRNDLRTRAGALVLALVLVLSLCPAALAAEDGVSISNLEQLTEFARNCASDTYSQGLTVRLTADIDAKESAVSVPVFYGTFDGQGHKISGLKLTDSDSEYGLFSRVETGAVIKDLNVSGDVTPGGQQTAVGGIAGKNSGTIARCTFSGVVSGTDRVGGIAGDNAGTVTDCTSSGVVRGSRYTGGTAGYNSGALLRCVNEAAVNTTLTQESLAALENLEESVYAILKGEELTEAAVTSDTGGIAGYSGGLVQSCRNIGDVGYPHVGYNVGGVAGRQSGYMASCENTGTVQGRKDVGGIVGQMAPDVTLSYAPGSLEELQEALNALGGSVDKTLADAQSVSDTVTARIDRISGYADTARDSANALTGQLTGFVNGNVDAVNSLVLLVERYLAKLSPILDDLSAASAETSETLNALERAADTLAGLAELNEEFLTCLEDFCRETSAACDDLSAAADALDAALALLEKGPARPDTTQLRADIAALREAAGDLETTVTRALEEISISGSVTGETRRQLVRDLRTVLSCRRAVIRDVVELLTKTDFSGLRDLNLETLRQVAQQLRTALQRLSSASGHLSRAMTRLGDGVSILRAMSPEVSDALSQLAEAADHAAKASDALTAAFEKMAQWARDLAEEEPVQFVGLGEDFTAGTDALNAALGGISSELSGLNGDLSQASSILIADLRTVNSQFMTVMNLFLNLLSNTVNVDYTGVWEDVSEESLQSAVRGKVLECVNRGAVEADRNVGGVAGSMAVEYDMDPEDDLLPEGGSTLRFTYQTRAVMMSCHSYGAVTAKKSCAGGVVGRMDLGVVSGCGGWGDVSSESGDYVGGVAGLSLSSIRGSWAKCALSGRKYVGGIAGSGGRITDCLTMVDITGADQLSGAIAGEITGTYSGSRFVSDTLAGVDRVSYAGKAEAVSYEQLCALENCPDQFRSLTVRFVADGETVSSQSVEYGGSFGTDVYPDLPEREGYYVHWDNTDLTDLRMDTVVTAVYEPYVTTLSAGQQNGHDAVLVLGQFREGDVLTAETASGDAPGDPLGTWRLSIPDDGQTAHEVRWRIPEGEERSLAVYTDRGRGPEKVSSTVSGSYLCFRLEGDRFTVSAVRKLTWLPWVIGGGAALLAGGGAAALVLVKKKRRKAAAGT